MKFSAAEYGVVENKNGKMNLFRLEEYQRGTVINNEAICKMSNMTVKYIGDTSHLNSDMRARHPSVALDSVRYFAKTNRKMVKEQSSQKCQL